MSVRERTARRGFLLRSASFEVLAPASVASAELDAAIRSPSLLPGYAFEARNEELVLERGSRAHSTLSVGVHPDSRDDRAAIVVVRKVIARREGREAEAARRQFFESRGFPPRQPPYR